MRVPFLHTRARALVSLLAADAATGPEKEEALRHLAHCHSCVEDLEALRAMLLALPRDEEAALPPIPVEALLTRVRARIESAPRARAPRWGWTGAAAAAAALGVVLPILFSAFGTRQEKGRSLGEAPMDERSLRRLERNVSREQAVRFLNDAGDVLVTMASEPRDCDREKRKVDVTDEARRSREILARRALLSEFQDEDVASARPVLEDVEQVLRQVASLESCARAGEVERVRRELERRQLLMKVRLMSRELQG